MNDELQKRLTESFFACLTRQELNGLTIHGTEQGLKAVLRELVREADVRCDLTKHGMKHKLARCQMLEQILRELEVVE